MIRLRLAGMYTINNPMLKTKKLFSRTFISSSLVLYELQKSHCVFDKVYSINLDYITSEQKHLFQPHQIGIAILELSKVIMQHYYYLVLKKVKYVMDIESREILCAMLANYSYHLLVSDFRSTR